jgi:K+-sensing histidine kinase KdpD
MASIIPSRSRPRTDSIGQPNLRLVARDPSHRAIDLLAQSSKTAVMACLTTLSSCNGELLRKASAVARENGGEFYAVLVDSPHNRFGNARVCTFIDDAILASYMGAKIIWLESSDVVGELLQFARQSGTGRIFVARNRPTPFSQLFERTICSELLSRARGFRIDVVGFERGN